MATKRPDVINHDKAVKFIRSVLQEKLGKVEWETTTPDINSIDIKGQVSKYDKKGRVEKIAIIVFDIDEYTTKGKISNTTINKIKDSYVSLQRSKADKKILIFTDIQAFQQWRKIAGNHELDDHAKAGEKFTPAPEVSNYFKDLTKEGKIVTMTIINMLIDFPVFRNEGWSKSKNDQLTFSHILYEWKNSFLKIEDLSRFSYPVRGDDVNESNQLPTSKKRQKPNPTYLDQLFTFFLEKRRYWFEKPKNKLKNTPSTTN